MFCLLPATGCGKKGPPLPPLRVIPERVSRVTLRQTGDRLVLSLPRPKSRTDGTPLGPDTRIELLMSVRDPAPKRPREIALEPSLTWSIPSGEWSAYMQGQRMEVGLDLARIASTLEVPTGPAGLRGRKMTFIVEVVEDRKHSEPSDVESIVICQPPAAPVATAARITEDGILLNWSPGAPAGAAPAAGTARFGIYRHEVGEPRSDTPLATAATGDGWLDTAAAIGRPYRYVIREHAGEGRCESADSPPLTAARVDLFPPAPPQGLAAIAEHGAIRLFWRPGREADLRGYRVYRADGPDKAFHLLTSEDLTSTSYTDEDVIAGVVYSYVVSARDGAEPVNESAWSDPAVETLKPDKEGKRP